MPGDTPVVVPVAAAEPEAPRLSQGQLKKLKQQRVKQRKAETLQFVRGLGVLDEIIEAAVFEGETSAAERLIEATHKQLMLDVATAVQQLDVSVAFLEGEIAREIGAIRLILDALRSEYEAEAMGEMFEVVGYLAIERDQLRDTLEEGLTEMAWDLQIDLVFDALFDALTTTIVAEREQLREAASGRNRGFIGQLFLAANPELAYQLLLPNVDAEELSERGVYVEHCHVCLAPVDIFDSSVSTLMCCDHRPLMCSGCRPEIVTSHAANPPPKGHVFEESFTHHVAHWVGRLRASVNR